MSPSHSFRMRCTTSFYFYNKYLRVVLVFYAMLFFFVSLFISLYLSIDVSHAAALSKNVEMLPSLISLYPSKILLAICPTTIPKQYF